MGEALRFRMRFEKKGASQSQSACFECGEEGHFARECPQNGGGRAIDFERDGDGEDAATKMKRQRHDEKQRRQHRKKGWKQIKRHTERQRKEAAMFNSFQDFVKSDTSKKRKDKKK